MKERVRLKRVHDPIADDDGVRVLVDRVWPRGIRKDALGHDHWLKDLAPSTELRKWFGHDPEKWRTFRQRYCKELDAVPEAVGPLLEMVRHGRVTLLFAARDREHNQAVVLRDYLIERLDRDAGTGDPASSPCSSPD